MFKDSATDLNEYATVVTDFIKKCVEDCIPTKTFRVFPNQKPWMNFEIRTLLKTRHRAFMSDDTVVYKKSRYDLGKAIKKAKRDFCSKLEDETDVRQLWRGLNAITSYKAKPGGSSNVGEYITP